MIKLFNNISLYGVLFLCILLTGCAAPYPHVEDDFQKNWIASEYQAEVYLLPSAPEAFAQRIKLVKSAQQSIDITYFSWNGDTLGLMLLDELKQAADRGVKVRIALDDLLVFNEKWLADIASHNNIDIHIFNPFNSRKMGWLGRSSDFLIHQQQLDNRLHEKYFNVDQQFMILGGRNIGDEYFGYSEVANFYDMDVLFQGDVIQAFASNYEQLWESEFLTPIADLINVKQDGLYKNFNKRYQKVRKKSALIMADIKRTLITMPEPIYTAVQVTPVFDSLDKLKDSMPYFRYRAERVIEAALSKAKKATISTPYIVPSDGDFKVIERLTKQGGQVKLLTNSSASNDSIFIPAYYEKHRETLLDMGVNILEYKDRARNTDHFYHENTYYHNKTIVLDNKISYIGSSNFDPRSDFLNIEFGLFVESESFANQVQNYLLQDKSGLYWQVLRSGTGDITWSSCGEVEVNNPNYGGWHRLPDWIFRKMNGESEL